MPQASRDEDVCPVVSQIPSLFSGELARPPNRGCFGDAEPLPGQMAKAKALQVLGIDSG